MKVVIIDDNHIMLQASTSEIAQYANYSRILIDNKDSFICSSEPSSTAFAITRPEGGSLFNTSLDISYSRFTTNELLFVFVEMDDLTYPFVLPCYKNDDLLNHVAKKSGIMDAKYNCNCNNDISMVYPIILYYGFKLSLAIFDYKAAIRYWNRL